MDGAFGARRARVGGETRELGGSRDRVCARACLQPRECRLEALVGIADLRFQASSCGSWYIFHHWPTRACTGWRRDLPATELLVCIRAAPARPDAGNGEPANSRRSSARQR